MESYLEKLVPQDDDMASDLGTKLNEAVRRLERVDECLGKYAGKELKEHLIKAVEGRFGKKTRAWLKTHRKEVDSKSSVLGY